MHLLRRGKQRTACRLKVSLYVDLRWWEKVSAETIFSKLPAPRVKIDKALLARLPLILYSPFLDKNIAIQGTGESVERVLTVKSATFRRCRYGRLSHINNVQCTTSCMREGYTAGHPIDIYHKGNRGIHPMSSLLETMPHLFQDPCHGPSVLDPVQLFCLLCELSDMVFDCQHLIVLLTPLAHCTQSIRSSNLSLSLLPGCRPSATRIPTYKTC